MKNRHGLAIACRGNYADKPPGALFEGNAADFSNQTRIVGLVIGITVSFNRIIRRVSRRVNPRCAMQNIHFQPRVVRKYQFLSRVQAVALCLLACVFFKRGPVFNHWSQRREI